MAYQRKFSVLGLLTAVLVGVIAGVHLQQYIDFMSEIRKVGVLFLLNAVGGAGLAVALLSRDRLLQILAAVGSIGLALGSLVCIVIALTGRFYGYGESTLRLPIVIAIVAEALAIPVLLTLMVRTPRRV